MAALTAAFRPVVAAFRPGVRAVRSGEEVVRAGGALVVPADGSGSTRASTAANPTAVQERTLVRSPYPNYRITVLDDDVNTFQHVVDCLVKILPGMQPDRAWELAQRIDGEGAAVVWTGPQEQAELYHQQLGAQGLTMAPLERA